MEFIKFSCKSFLDWLNVGPKFIFSKEMKMDVHSAKN